MAKPFEPTNRPCPELHSPRVHAPTARVRGTDWEVHFDRLELNWKVRLRAPALPERPVGAGKAAADLVRAL